MKTNSLSTKRSEHGTALLVTLFLCMILTVSIAGYMKHAAQQNYLSMRSQTWNMSMTVTEAGIEEALEHLNSNTGNLAVDGWTQSGTVYTVSRTLSATTRYTVSLDMASPNAPMISAQSFINSASLAMNDATSPILAVIGNSVPVQATTISRAVTVRAGKNGMFQRAMVAKHKIDMNGNNVTTDSFNSTDPAHSDNGMYPSSYPDRVLDNGDVASNDTIDNAVNAGNANIYGHVAVGPNGTLALGSQGSVGTHDWLSKGNKGVQPGYFSDDMNFTFPTVELPYNSGLTPFSGTISKTNYTLEYATNFVTTSTYPSPVPDTGVQTNVSYTTTAAKPSPAPYGLVTNVLSVLTTDNSFPKDGTYIGVPVKQANSKNWEYYAITGTNYTYPTFTYTYAAVAVSTIPTIVSSDYDYIIQGGAANMPPVDYYVTSIPSGNILVRGNARLVVAGNVDLGGNNANNQLTLDSDGKLEMWVGGTSCKLSGQGVVNPTGYAQNFLLWCTDSVTDFSLNGNGQLTGIVIAPNADVRLNGSGKLHEDFVGSLIANTITLNGHFEFHYDEALKSYKNTGRYIVKVWHEVPVPTVAAVIAE